MKKRWILLIVPLLMALMMNAASASELLGNVLSLVLNSPDDAVLADDCRADAEDARIIIASGAHYQLIAAAKQENGWESLDKRRLSAVGRVWRADAHADGRRL